MSLKHRYEKQDEIPSEYADLYTEKNGGFEVTGITGLRTQADVDRLKTSLTKEREDHKGTKERFAGFAELGDVADVQAKLDRIPELEAAASGKLDDAAIEEIVTRRVDGVIKSRLSPVERQLAAVTAERDTFGTENVAFRATEQKNALLGKLRPAMTALMVVGEHVEDVEMYAERHFEYVDGAFVTKDGVGVTPGLTPKDWLDEMTARKPGWLPGSQGGGARGGAGTPGGANPWTASEWNMTAQSAVYRDKGPEVAARMAKAAGSKVGATSAPVK